jgi:tRNA wybutosine-synthesizing protein 3
MAGFRQQKRQALNNLAASERVGDIDPQLKPLLQLINDAESYYTTSSCAGRITLMHDLGKKGSNEFVGKWHRKVEPGEVLDALTPCDGTVWFKYEAPILHVVAKDTESAARFMHASRGAGFKRTGIQSIKEGRVLIEVLSTERIEAPVSCSGERLASDEYIIHLTGEANLKFDMGEKKLKRLLDEVTGL